MRRAQTGFLAVPTLLVILGLALLGYLVWMPHARARATAATESRAITVLRPLLKATTARERRLATDPRAVEEIVRLVSARTGIALAILPPPAGASGGGLWFRGEDFAYRVCPADPKHLPEAPHGAKPRVGPTILPWEVYAWPLDRWSHARSAFFLAEDLPFAHSRNLHPGYLGLDPKRAPSPGSGRPRDAATARTEGDYRGRDDERWILSS